MNDIDGPAVAEFVYKEMFSGKSEYLNPDDIAYALDGAVRELRCIHSNPSRWATYVHIGI
jgi:hypothetical protein